MKKIFPFIALAALLAGCQPRLGDILNAPAPIILLDTIEVVTEKTVTDTIFLASEAVPYFDSVLCPPNLTVEQMYYVSDTVWLPGRVVPVTVTVHDTLLVPVPTDQTPGPVVFQDMSWPERLTWLTGVFALLFGLWKRWKEEQNQPAT